MSDKNLKGRGVTLIDCKASCHCTALQYTRLARVEADLTQTQLAKKVGALQKSISRYETGTSVPTVETLTKIANTLKKPSAYFLEDSS